MILYRALLRLYPASFRQEYGEAMALMFAERWAESGALARLGLLFGAVPEAVGNAALVHGEVLRQDVRYTVRTLRRSPGLALTAVLVIGLGVGANTAAFSVADFVLVRPLPFRDPGSLVRVCEGPREGPSGWGCMNQLSPANYRDIREQATSSFRAFGAFRRDAVNLAGEGDPRRVGAAAVTGDVFRVLGVAPALGSVFEAGSERRAARTVVLSWGLWRARFGGDPGVLGRSITVDGTPHVITAVMPASFVFPGRDAALWLPLVLGEDDYAQRGNTYLEGVARLAPGVSFEQARADLDVIMDRLARLYPENEEVGVSFFRLRDEFSPRYRLMLQALCGASLCILLLACANLGNLLLARAAERERELALRSALGAGRERLLRQMATESIVLAVLGGAAGLAFALLVFPLLRVMVPPTLAVGSEPTLDFRALALAALFTALAVLAFGLLPTWWASRRAALAMLRGRSGTPTRRARRLLLALEVAAAVVLLVPSGLLVRALLRVQQVEPGFRADHALSVRTVLPKPEYGSAAQRERFYGDVLSAVRRLPGVTGAAYISGLPMVMWGGIQPAVLPGQEVRPDGDYMVSRRYVTTQYFTAMGVPLVRGRDLEEAEIAAGHRVAVVSESFVRRYWPDGDALGRVFRFRNEEWRVVGVVGDVRVRGLERESEPQIYLPSSLAPEGPLTFYDPKDLVIRTTGEPTAILPAVRAIVHEADPDQPVSDEMTLEQLLATQVAPRRAQVQLLGALAAIALLLVGVGINGLLAYTVAQQRPEIGIRLALGARPARIARAILADGLAITLLGMVPGLIIAILTGRLLFALLFGVPAVDPATLAFTVALCALMAIIGALVPALRALRTSPMIAMRGD